MCITSLRRYRNLHPTFSKVGPPFSATCLRRLNIVHIYSKSIKFLVRSTLNWTCTRNTPRLVLSPPLLDGSRKASKMTVRSRQRWRASMIRLVRTCTWKGMASLYYYIKVMPFIVFRLPLSIDEPVMTRSFLRTGDGQLTICDVTDLSGTSFAP